MGCTVGGASALKLVAKLLANNTLASLLSALCPQLLPPAHHWAVQACEIEAASAVGSRGDHHHTAGRLSWPGPQQVRQQERGPMVHTQQQVKGSRVRPQGTDPWGRG